MKKFLFFAIILLNLQLVDDSLGFDWNFSTASAQWSSIELDAVTCVGNQKDISHCPVCGQEDGKCTCNQFGTDPEEPKTCSECGCVDPEHAPNCSRNPNTDPNTGGGGGGSIGNYHPNNNDVQINPPLLAIHQPVEGEHLFKDELPAQSMKQATNKDCVSTAMANLMYHQGCEYSAETIRYMINQEYKNTFHGNLPVDGVDIDDFCDFMGKRGFFSVESSDIISTLNEGYACVGVVDTKDGQHMLEIVGYFDDDWGQSFQCINPGTGLYETHYLSEFEKFPHYIYRHS